MSEMIFMASFGSVFRFIAQGGVFMILLLLCSVVAVAVIVMRGLALRRIAVVPWWIAGDIETLRPGLAEDLGRLERRVAGDESALGRVVAVALQHLPCPRAENAEAVQMAARHEVVRLEGGLFLLEIIVGVAPLLGLLGAVAGLVTVFANLGTSETVSDPRGIAQGISEALGTTIVGLAVAIPCLMAHSFYSRKIEAMMADMEALLGVLLAKFYGSQAALPGGAAGDGSSEELRWKRKAGRLSRVEGT